MDNINQKKQYDAMQAEQNYYRRQNKNTETSEADMATMKTMAQTSPFVFTASTYKDHVERTSPDLKRGYGN